MMINGLFAQKLAVRREQLQSIPGSEQKQVSHSLLESTAQGKIQEKYPLQDLDNSGRLDDNELCLVFGDGVQGRLANYICAIDRFSICNSHMRLSKNPRKYIRLRDLDEEERRLLLRGGA